MARNEHVHETFREFLNEIATESVNGSCGGSDRWECGICGTRHSTRSAWVQCESSCADGEGLKR